jgi:hypothetical protein
MAAIQLKEKLRTKALDKVVHFIREHNFTWDELHQAIMRAQAEKLIPTVREVIAGREFEYKRLGEYVIAMHKLCGGLPVVKYKDETGATVLTRINAGVVLGYLQKGEAAERVAEGFQNPVEAVKEVGELAAFFDYDRRYA